MNESSKYSYPKVSRYDSRKSRKQKKADKFKKLRREAFQEAK